MTFYGTLFVGHDPISTRNVLFSLNSTMMPDFPIDESEGILQEDEDAEDDDIPEMEEEDD